MKLLIDDVCGITVTMYGALSALSLLLFWLVGLLWLKKKHVSGGTTVCWMALTAVCGLLVSRIVFVACNAAYYMDELDGCWTPALYFWDGGYSMIGLLMGAVLGAWLTSLGCGSKRNDLLNAVGLGAPLGIAMLRLAEFLCDTEESGDIGEGNFVEETGWLEDLLGRLGLMMQGDGDAVYPACLALCAFTVLLFVGLFIWAIIRGWEIPCADMLTVSLLVYGSGMMVLEQLRNDGHLVFHFVHLEQVLALVLAVVSLLIWTKRFLREKTKSLQLPVTWIAVVVCIGLAIFACFGIDRWENKTLAWLMLIIPVAVQAVLALNLRTSANYLTGEK